MNSIHVFRDIHVPFCFARLIIACKTKEVSEAVISGTFKIFNNLKYLYQSRLFLLQDLKDPKDIKYLGNKVIQGKIA